MAQVKAKAQAMATALQTIGKFVIKVIAFELQQHCCCSQISSVVDHVDIQLQWHLSHAWHLLLQKKVGKDNQIFGRWAVIQLLNCIR